MTLLHVDEERLRLALESADAGLWDWNPVTGELLTSARWSAMLGYEPGELPGDISAWEPLCHPDDLAEVQRRVAEHFAGRTSEYACEHRLRHKSGEYVWVFGRAKVVARDADGRPLRVVGTNVDISERKRAEQALRQSEERFRAAVDGTLDAFYLFECQRDEAGNVTDFVFVDVNERAERQLSMPRTSLIGRGMCEVFPINRTGGFFERYLHVFETRTRLRSEYRIPDDAAAPGWYEQQVVPLPDGIAIFNRSITDRKRAEEDREAMARELHTTLTNLQNVIVKVERRDDGAFVHAFVEGKLARDLGLSTEKIAGKSAREVFGATKGALLEDAYAKAFGGAEVALELELGGRHFWTILSPLAEAPPAPAPSETPSSADAAASDAPASPAVRAIIGSAIETTYRVIAERERARLEEQLAARQRLESLGLLAGGIAHDFNNMLMALLTEADTAQREVRAGSSAHEALSAVQTIGRRMGELTSQLLAYAGRGQVALRPVDPNAVTSESVELLRRTLAKDIALEGDLSAEPVSLEAEPSQLQQVVMNLVLNAADALRDAASKSEGSPGRDLFLRVRTRQLRAEEVRANAPGIEAPHGAWVLEVADNGCGMTPEVRARIFDPFFTTKAEGRGLGLSAVHGIVRRLGGAIDVESAVAVGTTFRVVLPRSAATIAPPADPPKPAAQRGSLRILVVEDEEVVQKALGRMLRARGWDVTLANDGVEAIGIVDQRPHAFDVALVDVNMPRAGGIEVLRAIRERRLALPVVLMSGYAESQTRELTTLPPDGFLEKPFPAERLDRILERVLTRREANGATHVPQNV
jgi:PAS domain S-box-containing protein